MRFILTFWLILLPAVGWAQAELCQRAAEGAARSYNIPPDIFEALTLVETGQMQNGRLQPWPWSVQFDGQGHRFTTQKEAEVFAENLVLLGQTNFDLGCFQINWRWHGAQMSTTEDFLNPRKSADYAAQLLRGHFEKLGDWAAAAGAYHSVTAEHAQRYRTRFDAILTGLRHPQPVQRQPQSLATFFGGGGGLGSLVPRRE